MTVDTSLYVPLDKEKHLVSETQDAKLDLKKTISNKRVIPILTDKALWVESCSNCGKVATLNTAHNPDEKSNTIIEPRTEKIKYKHSNNLNENSLKNHNIAQNEKNTRDTTAWTEKHSKNNVIPKFEITGEIDEAKDYSDVPITRKKNCKCSIIIATEKKCLGSARDGGILQVESTLLMNQFEELHCKVETKLNTNYTEKEFASKLQESKTSLSKKKIMSSYLENYHEQISETGHLNFPHDSDKLTVEARSEPPQHLTAKVKTNTDCLDSHKHYEQKSEPENLNHGHNTAIIHFEISIKPSQIPVEIIETKTGCFLQPQNLKPIKRKPERFVKLLKGFVTTDETPPEIQNENDYARPNTDKLVPDTKVTKDLSFSDIVKDIMTRSRNYRSVESPEPTYLFRISSSYNVYPRRQRASNHFKWLQKNWMQDNERQAWQSHPSIIPLKKKSTQPKIGPTRQGTESLSTKDIILPLYIQNQHDPGSDSGNLNIRHNADKQAGLSNEPSQLLSSSIDFKIEIHEKKASRTRRPI